MPKMADSDEGAKGAATGDDGGQGNDPNAGGGNDEGAKGSGGSGGADAAAGNGGGDGGEFDRERAMRTIRTQREAETRLQRELAEAKRKLQEREEAELSDAQKKDKRIEELEGELGSTRRESEDAFLRAAIADSKHSVASASDVALLLRNGGIEFDEKHKPRDLDSRLEALLKDKPYLRGGDQGPPPGDADGGKGSGGENADMNARLRKAAGRA